MIDHQKIAEVNAWDTFGVNCWGGTQYVLGVVSQPLWQSPDSMTIFLHRFTDVIDEKEIQENDILCCQNNKLGLIHTALYFGKSIWWHKPGINLATFDSKESIDEMYNKPLFKDESEYYIEYRRFNKDKWNEHFLDQKPTIKHHTIYQIYKNYELMIYNYLYCSIRTFITNIFLTKSSNIKGIGRGLINLKK